MKKVEEIGRREGPVFQILSLKPKKVGIIVTGSEIFEKRIKDHSIGVVTQKVESLGSRVARKAVVPDDPARIALEIRKMKSSVCSQELKGCFWARRWEPPAFMKF